MPIEHSKTQSIADGHFHSGIAPIAEAPVANRQNQKMVAASWSYRLSSRVRTVEAA